MKSFGHTRPVRDPAGIITGSKPSPVKARTLANLGPSFGADRKHRLIVTLDAGDVVTLRPEKTARSVSITATDLYRHMLRCLANSATLAKARERKARKAQRLAALRQQRAETRLFRN